MRQRPGSCSILPSFTCEVTVKAAVLNEIPGDLIIEDVSIDKPGPGEVLLQTVNAGLCHSDLHFIDGSWQYPPPVVLGHEAAGVVEAVGEGVTEFAEGDHVIACASVFQNLTARIDCSMRVRSTRTRTRREESTIGLIARVLCQILPTRSRSLTFRSRCGMKKLKNTETAAPAKRTIIVTTFLRKSCHSADLYCRMTFMGMVLVGSAGYPTSPGGAYRSTRCPSSS